MFGKFGPGDVSVTTSKYPTVTHTAKVLLTVVTLFRILRTASFC